MYSESDLEAAVAAGALSAEAAASLRAYVESRDRSPAVDEEHFRLITGFNDIFVAIAAALLLAALAWIGYSIGPRIEGDGPSPTMGLFVAGAAWGLAEFFTRKRRMALPSILLLSLPMLAASLWALRRGASVHPALSGAAAGLLSAGLGTGLYAFFCIEDSPLFYGVWYVLAILGVAALGALVGARLLRW